MIKILKKLVKKGLRKNGYKLTKIQPKKKVETPEYVVATMYSILRDLKERGLQCTHIMDVGANRTSWSRIAKGFFPDATFCLIEPQVEMEEGLQQFISDFPGDLYYLAGAGSKKETLVLTVYDDLAGSSFLPNANPELKKEGKQREIEIITLDDIISDSTFEIPQLVKLDIQGFELEALKGATSLFGKTEVFILEVSLFAFGSGKKMPEFAEVISFMYERGYVAYDFPGFLRRPLDKALGQCDVCFVKENGFLRASHHWK
ncbi:FkbM family methyltransferase [Jejudonia soesokkakensis]|uniref:FkbM family methyltransferase n=1 Tax=Jejudonia soesokkakensis TaxID=1323432 RepID=A0ABW2MTL1_9FLAO